ncbi:hypothetical protein K443DRAFT_3915 [Laccaria amethystina LaAM-08-1]|uniref:Dipeptidylpeptidase IV N-terminal domain-containing protein n=1 Tax=Laccaria amethystina LaAM-08-1 TaxID=1095629 RepID=A0A0C9X038_9AGAR|nr:hypothetical protein K443DRAFT_3915 [Laccaria amethystina LaAM-08-1]
MSGKHMRVVFMSSTSLRKLVITLVVPVAAIGIIAKTTHPILPSSRPSQTAFATWSPTGEAITYVTDNDLYILSSAAPNTKPIRITSTGNAFPFQSVSDWTVVEEFRFPIVGNAFPKPILD